MARDDLQDASYLSWHMSTLYPRVGLVCSAHGLPTDGMEPPGLRTIEKPGRMPKRRDI